MKEKTISEFEALVNDAVKEITKAKKHVTVYAFTPEQVEAIKEGCKQHKKNINPSKITVRHEDYYFALTYNVS